MPTSSAKRKTTCATRAADAARAMRAHCRRLPARAGWRSAARSPGRRCRARGRTRALADPSPCARSSGSARTPACTSRRAHSSSSCAQRDVADAERARLAVACELAPSRATPANPRRRARRARRPVQHVRVEVVGAQVLERRRERLRHLLAVRRRRVVRQAMILPADVGELGLQEQLGARDDAVADGAPRSRRRRRLRSSACADWRCRWRESRRRARGASAPRCALPSTRCRRRAAALFAGALAQHVALAELAAGERGASRRRRALRAR